VSNKDKINELRNKLYNKKKELQVKQAEQEILDKLTNITYDVYQDPDKKGKHFLIVEIQYNPETKMAVVSEPREFENKTTGLAIVMDKDNRKYLYNKCKRRLK